LKAASEPMFNVPPAVIATLAVFAVVHAVRELILSPPAAIEFLLLFAFIPARYDMTVLPHGVIPGGWAADVWTFVSYSLIHGNLLHLGLNAVWLLPFGSAVARRFGSLRYLGFFAVTAAAGAATHLATHIGELTPMVGASAAISGYMAASIRFVFHRAGPLGLLRGRDPLAYRVPAIPLTAALRDFRVVVFVAVWFGLNLVFGAGSVAIGVGEASVAWQAHVGGFVAGLIVFSVFDPVRAPAPGPADSDSDAESMST
jgi:membrane associated rhomboid family serine protease